MSKKLILIAAVNIALYRPHPEYPFDAAKGTRINIEPGQPLPDDLTRAERDELGRLGAFKEQLVAAPAATLPAGGDIPGTNTSAAEEGTDADVSGDGAATAAPESSITSAEAPAHSDEGEAPPAGGRGSKAAGK